MKVLILAAGFSTRLYPLTEKFPKGLLKIKDKPILSYLLDEVVKIDELAEVALITNDVCYEHFSQFLAKNDDFFHITLLSNGVSDQNKRLGAIGDLQLAIDQLGWQDDDILVLPSDTLVSLDLRQLLKFYKKNKGFVNVVYDAHDKEIIQDKLGCAELQGDKLVNFEEKPTNPKSTWQSVPIYIYPQKTLSLVKQYTLDKSNNLDSPGAIIPFLIKKTKGRTFAFQIKNGFYHDVGTKEVFEELNKMPHL